jgi:hypothetical protein
MGAEAPPSWHRGLVFFLHRPLAYTEVVMLQRRTRIRVIVIALAIGTPSSAVAQTDLTTVYPGLPRLDVSGVGGFQLSTDWSNLVLLGAVSPSSGAIEQVLSRDLTVRPGPVFDAVVTYWEGRYGFRTHVGFAQSCLTTGTTCADVGARVPTSVDMNAWTYDVGGSIGLIDHRPGLWAWPYVFLGFGAVTYDLDRPVGAPLTFIERNPPRMADDRLIVSEDDADTLLITIDELSLETKFAVNLGVGTDLRVPLGPASVGLRLELSDHIHPSPIDIVIVELDRFHAGRGETRVESGFVHNLRAAAGLVLQFGR